KPAATNSPTRLAGLVWSKRSASIRKPANASVPPNLGDRAPHPVAIEFRRRFSPHSLRRPNEICAEHAFAISPAPATLIRHETRVLPPTILAIGHRGGLMQRILSTYRYVHQPLTAALLAEIARAEIAAIEVFSASSHFNYRDEQKVRELADALGEYHLELHSLHSPTERDLAPGRESGVPISISDTERIRRLDAVDEVKRALDVAERIPFRYLIQHIGQGRQSADPRNLDAAFTSLEILSVFAKARGVTIALENTPNEIGTPTSLQHFIVDTHLHDLRLCLDTGHAHME